MCFLSSFIFPLYLSLSSKLIRKRLVDFLSFFSYRSFSDWFYFSTSTNVAHTQRPCSLVRLHTAESVITARRNKTRAISFVILSTKRHEHSLGSRVLYTSRYAHTMSSVCVNILYKEIGQWRELEKKKKYDAGSGLMSLCHEPDGSIIYGSPTIRAHAHYSTRCCVCHSIGL